MNRREAERLARQESVLVNLGFTWEEAAQLRRISMTLRRWHERECGTDSGCIERGRKELNPATGKREFVSDENGAPYWGSYSGDKPHHYRVPDRERGAHKRLAGILRDRNARMLPLQSPDKLQSYIQGDPRGAALYILRPGDVPEGQSADAYYSRGVCVY